MRTATKPFSSLTAADLMSRDVVVIPRHLSLRMAAHLLAQSKVSGAPVIDGCGACVGVISSTDFVNWAQDEHAVRHDRGHCTCATSEWQVFDPEALPLDEVGRHMTADPVTAAEGTRIGELARMMLDAHIHRVVIVDEKNRPVGVVSSTDIIAAVAESEWRP
jgi:CBS-domain-containing membrane protein